MNESNFIGYIHRDTLALITRGNQRALREFEEQAQAVADSEEALNSQDATTRRMKDAKVLVLSSNAEFENERIVEAGAGIELTEDGDRLIIGVGKNGVSTEGGFGCRFVVEGETLLVLPLEGVVATHGNIETLSNKTLSAPSLSDLGDYANDAAAATGGVPVGGIYRDGSNLRVRVT